MDPEMNTPELDSFDRALLTELRQVVAEKAATPASASRRKWFAGGGIAAAAVAALGLATLNPASAYAVDETGSGAVVITIHKLSDAAGLEKALADHGIDATVDYDAATTSPASGPSVPPAGVLPGPPAGLLPGPGQGTVQGQAQLLEGVSPNGEPSSGAPKELPPNACGDFDHMPFTTDVRDDTMVITIPADSVLQASDSTLKLTTSGDLADKVAGLNVSYTAGGVDCNFGSVSAQASAAQSR